MIIDQRDIDSYKRIANALYLPMIIDDYGHDKQDTLLNLTDSISKIYKYLLYNSFKTVTIYCSIENTSFLATLANKSQNTILSYENLSPLTGENIVIEVKPNGELHYILDFSFDVNANRKTSIIYHFEKETETETIYGKLDSKILPPIPDSDSYFAIQTYKDLDLALEDYNTKVAKYSECGWLKDVWADTNRIFLKPKPEHTLRNSLTYFLKIRLRNTEVRPEQIVDTSHPVDIKITWTLASHLALIEIKWLGKSLESEPIRKITQVYTDARALEGATQLSEYLNENQMQAPVKSTKGYLVIFDARRWNTNESSVTVTKSNGLKYQNEEVVYKPDYNMTRIDFAKPRRFFMHPINMTS